MPDRAPEGWVRGAAHTGYVRLPGTTTPAPVGLPGPLRCPWDPPRAKRLGSTPCTHPPYTHPVYPPCIPTPVHPPDMHTAADRDQYGTSGTCTYDRFQDLVGEPRGVRTQPVFRVPGWFILVLRFRRPFDWVLLSSGPCFTEFSTWFTEFWTLFY